MISFGPSLHVPCNPVQLDIQPSSGNHIKVKEICEKLMVLLIELWAEINQRKLNFWAHTGLLTLFLFAAWKAQFSLQKNRNLKWIILIVLQYSIGVCTLLIILQILLLYSNSIHIWYIFYIQFLKISFFPTLIAFTSAHHTPSNIENVYLHKSFWPVWIFLFPGQRAGFYLWPTG